MYKVNPARSGPWKEEIVSASRQSFPPRSPFLCASRRQTNYIIYNPKLIWLHDAAPPRVVCPVSRWHRAFQFRARRLDVHGRRTRERRKWKLSHVIISVWQFRSSIFFCPAVEKLSNCAVTLRNALALGRVLEIINRPLRSSRASFPRLFLDTEPTPVNFKIKSSLLFRMENEEREIHHSTVRKYIIRQVVDAKTSEN